MYYEYYLLTEVFEGVSVLTLKLFRNNRKNMNAITVQCERPRGRLWGNGYMADPEKKEQANKKKPKTTLDADDDVARILEAVASKGLTKGAFLNACVRKAWRPVLDDLIATLKDFQKPGLPPDGKKPKEGNKP